jgi:hypothetical protein
MHLVLRKSLVSHGKQVLDKQLMSLHGEAPGMSQIPKLPASICFNNWS